MEKNLLTFERNSNIGRNHLHVSRKKVADVYRGKYISFTEQSSWKFVGQMAYSQHADIKIGIMV